MLRLMKYGTLCKWSPCLLLGASLTRLFHTKQSSRRQVSAKKEGVAHMWPVMRRRRRRRLSWSFNTSSQTWLPVIGTDCKARLPPIRTQQVINEFCSKHVQAHTTSRSFAHTFFFRWNVNYAMRIYVVHAMYHHSKDSVISAWLRHWHWIVKSGQHPLSDLRSDNKVHLRLHHSSWIS